jgi:hypothetical protein
MTTGRSCYLDVDDPVNGLLIRTPRISCPFFNRHRFASALQQLASRKESVAW